MGDIESNCEACGESSRLVGKKDESLALGSLYSGRISRQYTESGPSTSTHNLPLQEERIEVGFDLLGFTRFHRHPPRIFEAVARGDDKELSNLLNTCMIEVQSIDSKGNTALHHAVASACRKDDWDDSLYQCIDLLMSCEQMNVNMPNKKGYTAIGLAVHHLHKKCIEHILKHPSAERLYLEYCPGDRESTVRELIMEIYPELQSRLPAPLKESLESSDIDKKLLAALQRNIFEVFPNYLSQTNPNPWFNEPYHSSLLEMACQMKNRKKFVKLLLANGAYPNIKNHVTGMPLIHATARSGNFEALQLLLEKKRIDANLKDHEERTILHWLAGVNEGKPGDKDKIEKCLKYLLDSNYIRKNIDDRDSLGNTPLYITVESEFRGRAKLLLSRGADVRVFERGSKILLSDSVSIVEEILDDCLQYNKKLLTSKDLQLKLNYQSFMNIVPHIAESKLHRDLLTHPVISSFLTIKWENLKHFFFLYMAFYATFLCFLTLYILLCEPHNTLNDGGAASNTTDHLRFNNSNITSGTNDSNVTSQPNISRMRLLQNFLMISLILLTLKEMQQLIVHRCVYIKSLENWLVILLIISTFISCSGVVGSTEMKTHFSAVALFLGWSELLMLSGRLPQLSEQFEMLRTVSVTFLSFMAGYVTLLIAFAFSFYILFKGSSNKCGADVFANPRVSLLKTIVMFTGEFDASSLSFDALPYTSHVIFLLFVVLVAIVLLNLLNGLAVNNTGEIRKDAEMLSLAERAKLISRIEGFVNAHPKCMKTSVELKENMFLIYPKRRSKIGSDNVRSLLRKIGEKRTFQEKEKSNAFPKEWIMITEKLERLEKKLDSLFEESQKIPMEI
jgi:ankyrin repeat protein